jgi:CRP-like cAMP-binding protein
MNKQQHQMMSILQKIRVFNGMSLGEAERLLGICAFKRFKAGEHVFVAGQLSDSMLVLISGSLAVLDAGGQKLGGVQPGQSTGEMGVFTGHRRSATVAAEKDSAGLLIKKDVLNGLMHQDRDLTIRILENVVELLAERLADANRKVHELLTRPAAEPEPASGPGPPAGQGDGPGEKAPG